MSKNKQSFKQAKITETSTFSLFPFQNSRIAYLVLGIIGFIFYINTISNEFALDDGIIIHKNEYVMKGTKGVKDIMTHDAYYSFYRQMNAEDQLAGGRYRPLSVVTFAMEQNLIGTFPGGKTNANSWDKNNNSIQDPDEDVNEDGLFNENDALTRGCGLRHFNNMLIYVLSILVLFGFLKNYLFRNNLDMAFLTTLLFCIHPLHTEVVANMKSRDEIMSFLFIILTCIYSFKALEQKKTWYFIAAGILYFLAWLSKEYAFTLIFLIPMMIFIFRPELITFKQVKIYAMFALLVVFGFFMYKSKMATELKMPSKVILPFVAFPAIVLISTACIIVFEHFDHRKHPDEKRNLASYIVAMIVTAVICLFIHMIKKVDLYILMPLVFTVAVIGIMGRDAKAKNFNFLYGSLLITFVVYIALRFYSVTLKPGVPDTEVLNNPYLFATKTETYATKIFVLLKYIKLLFVPYPLSSDYSFKTILYRNFGSWDTLLSIFVYLSLAGLTVWLFLKRHPLAFGLLFFFANLFMIGNIVFDIGATMGERLIYHSSFGFALCIAWLLIEGLKKINIQPALQKNVVIGLAVALTCVFGYITIKRNAEWKSDITLFTTDVNTVPNSVLCLGNAGARYIDLSERPENKDSAQAYLVKATGYLKHSLELHPKYVNGYLNLGLAQMKQGKFDDAYNTWKTAEKYYPNNPYLQTYFPYLAINYMNKGVNLGKEGKLDEATKNLDRAVQCNPNNYDIWYNYAGVYFTKGDLEKAMTGFQNCLKLNPNAENAKQGLLACQQQLSAKTTSTVAVKK